MRMVTIIEVEKTASKKIFKERSQGRRSVDNNQNREGHVANEKAEESKDLGF